MYGCSKNCHSLYDKVTDFPFSFNEIQLEIVSSVWFEAIWYLNDYKRLLNEKTRASHVN